MTRVVAVALLAALALAGVAVGLERTRPGREIAVAIAAPAQSVGVLPPVGARLSRKRPAPAAAKPAPAEEPLVSLDELTRIPAAPPTGPQSVEWERVAKPAEPAASPAKRFHLDYSHKKILEDVPTQPDRSQTDVGVTLRVDPADRLRVRGGVRVDEEKRGEAEPQRDATPSVGVEVRF